MKRSYGSLPCHNGNHEALPKQPEEEDDKVEGCLHIWLNKDKHWVGVSRTVVGVIHRNFLSPMPGVFSDSL